MSSGVTSSMWAEIDHGLPQGSARPSPQNWSAGSATRMAASRTPSVLPAYDPGQLKNTTLQFDIHFASV